jgi:hypothetical protein
MRNNANGARVALFTVAGLLMLAAACSQDPVDPHNSPPPSSPSRQSGIEIAAQAELLAAQQGSSSRGFEDEILRLEARVPGVGGVYRDSLGRVVVYLSDPAMTASVISEIKSLAQTLRVDSEMSRALADGDVVVRAGANTFSELVAWENAVAPFATAVAGFHSIDADESLNRVRVTVATSASQEEMTNLLISKGMPPSLFVVDLSVAAVPLGSIRGTFRPTGGGIQIANGFNEFCSLGYNVTTSLGETGFLTAGHCVHGTSFGTGVTGGTMYQPIIGTQYAIGTILLNPVWNNTSANCGTYTRCTYADALFVQYTTPSNGAKQVAHTTSLGGGGAGGGITFKEWWPNIQSVPLSYVGMPVDKVGRSTGWTRGTIQNTCENRAVTVVPSSMSYMALCVDHMVVARTGQGDSGSPVFVAMSNGKLDPFYPLGILFAGGPLDSFDGSDPAHPFYFCSNNAGTCEIWYNPWTNINTQLGRVFSPVP